MKKPISEQTAQQTLEENLQRMQRFQAAPGLGKRALGAAEWDRELWKLGREWIKSHSAAPEENSGGDVYLATQLYPNGGHTALIGDFVRALDSSTGEASHLVLTDIHARHTAPLSEEILARVAMQSSQISILAGPGLADRMDQLLDFLRARKPRRLFLFHHPEDPLAPVAAQPELAGQSVLVHHADSTPCFGLHVPGMRIIDLNPIASAMSRLLGLDPALLLLTTPDPGPRPRGFLQRGLLTTASCGSQHKFTTPYFYSYADTVAEILRTTGGEHVHIGPMNQAMLGEIHAALEHAGIAPQRLIHIPWTANLPRCLWEHGCDLYFSSFPIDGARTNAEVLASATPHLRHVRHADDVWIEGSLTWRTWEDLAQVLTSCASADVLEEKSRLMRRAYDEQHHPLVFSETLVRILDGGPGWPDERQLQRDQRSVHSLLKSLTTSLAKLPDRMDRLEQENQALRDQLANFQSESKLGREGKSLRAKILRWLMRD